MAELRAVGWKGGGFVGELKGHGHWVCSVCVTPDGEYAVTASVDATARVWRLADGLLLRKLQGSTLSPSCARMWGLGGWGSM
eukprot:6005979-Pleurochrysis_carterae.AAC.1